jgi:ABC-type multidrug transport system ATPase subunit
MTDDVFFFFLFLFLFRCGKSTMMKVLSGRMRLSGDTKQSGTVTYNHEAADCGKFLLPKVVDYVEQEDVHAPTLTVLETFEFAFRTTSGGHHSYGVAKNATSAELLDRDDPLMAKVLNITSVLGLSGCKNVIVGDGMIRGVSGGQKKRVSLGEMMVTAPSRIKFLDSISNGLDAATTFDITNSLKLLVIELGLTFVAALLQPPPEVFNLFDFIILMSEGQIIYQGPRDEIMNYFKGLGYQCPPLVDIADYLQELTTPEGARFLQKEEEGKGGKRQHLNTAMFVAAWKNSLLFKSIMEVVEEGRSGATSDAPAAAESVITDPVTAGSVEMVNSTPYKPLSTGDTTTTTTTTTSESDSEWTVAQNTPFPGSLWFHFNILFDRQYKLTSRNTGMIKARLIQTLVNAAIIGSLFNNLPTSDTQTMMGLLFSCTLGPALANMSMIPSIINERDVFYKHADASFYPTAAYVLAQTLVLLPLQALEAVLSCSITYWACGLSDANGGSHYFMFLFMNFSFATCSAQLFRLVGSSLPSATTAQPLAGVITVMLVLFSGFIAAPDQIPDGWIWLYWMNPMSWALRGM